MDTFLPILPQIRTEEKRKNANGGGKTFPIFIRMPIYFFRKIR